VDFADTTTSSILTFVTLHIMQVPAPSRRLATNAAAPHRRRSHIQRQETHQVQPNQFSLKSRTKQILEQVPLSLTICASQV